MRCAVPALSTQLPDRQGDDAKRRYRSASSASGALAPKETGHRDDDEIRCSELSATFLGTGAEATPAN